MKSPMYGGPAATPKMPAAPSVKPGGGAPLLRPTKRGMKRPSAARKMAR